MKRGKSPPQAKNPRLKFGKQTTSNRDEKITKANPLTSFLTFPAS